MGRPPQSEASPSSPRVITFGFLCIRITIELHSLAHTHAACKSGRRTYSAYTKAQTADKGLAVVMRDDDDNNNSKNGKEKIYAMCVCAASERNSLVKGCRLAFLDTRSDLQLAACRFSQEVGLEGTICRTPATAAAAPLMCSMHWPTSRAE
jgi:hypothetical protein